MDRVVTFAASYLALRFLAWVSTGLIYGMGFNLATRFAPSVMISFLASALAGAIVFGLFKNVRWALVATVCMITAHILDIQWYQAVGGFDLSRLLVTSWETFWPAAAACWVVSRLSARTQVRAASYY